MNDKAAVDQAGSTVRIGACNREYTFCKGITTETKEKYTRPEI